MTAEARAKPSVAGLATALAILGQLGVLRATLGADDTRAYFLGRSIELACGLRARGIPCPGCGFTRAVAFALRGDVVRALHLNAAATIAVLGLLLVAAGLLGVDLARRSGWRSPWRRSELAGS